MITIYIPKTIELKSYKYSL